MKRYLLGLLVEKGKDKVVVSLGIYFLEVSATFRRRYKQALKGGE